MVFYSIFFILSIFSMFSMFKESVKGSQVPEGGGQGGWEFFPSLTVFLFLNPSPNKYIIPA